jgi:hypothetical protein
VLSTVSAHNIHKASQFLKTAMDEEKTLELEAMDIRVIKAPGDLHRKLERLQSKFEYERGTRPTKSELVIELLETHPRTRSL